MNEYKCWTLMLLLCWDKVVRVYNVNLVTNRAGDGLNHRRPSEWRLMIHKVQLIVTTRLPGYYCFHLDKVYVALVGQPICRLRLTCFYFVLFCCSRRILGSGADLIAVRKKNKEIKL